MKRVIKKILCTFALFAILYPAIAQHNNNNSQRLRLMINFMDFGVSHIIPTGDLSNYFAPFAGVHLGFGFELNRFYIGAQMQGGLNWIRLNRPLLGSTTGYHRDFQKGDYFDYVENLGLIGYTLIRNRWLELTPIIGLGTTKIRSRIYGGESNRDEFTIVNSFTVNPGLRADFPLIRIGEAGNHIRLRLYAGYNMPVRFRYAPARGNTFSVRAGIVWWLLGD